MTTDNKYSKVLLELKTHYQQTLAELETQTSQLKTKITSLDTLIEDPVLGSDLFSILQGEVDSLTSADSAPASKTAKTVKPTAEPKPKKTTPSSGKRKSPTSKKSDSTPKSNKSIEPKVEAKPKKASQKVSPSSLKKKSATPKKDASQTAAKNKSQKKTSGSSSSILTMNKPYDKMKKIDAITQIMHENPGKDIHYDDLILQLYGELSGDELKAERGRIKVAMYQGAKNDRWRKANVQMCYVYEPSLHTGPAKSTTTKGQKSRKKT